MQKLFLETDIVLSGLHHRADTAALLHFMFWNILSASLALYHFKKLLTQSLRPFLPPGPVLGLNNELQVQGASVCLSACESITEVS